MAAVILVFSAKTMVNVAVVTFDFETPQGSTINPELTQDGITISFVTNTSVNAYAVAQLADATLYNGSVGAMRLTQSGGSPPLPLPLGVYLNFSTTIYSMDWSVHRYEPNRFQDNI